MDHFGGQPIWLAGLFVKVCLLIHFTADQFLDGQSYFFKQGPEFTICSCVKVHYHQHRSYIILLSPTHRNAKLNDRCSGSYNQNQILLFLDKNGLINIAPIRCANIRYSNVGIYNFITFVDFSINISYNNSKISIEHKKIIINIS